MAEPVEFHEIHIGVRPTRAAVRIGSYDGWEHAALRVLEVLSVAWGGAGDIVVSCDEDGLVPDQLWAAVELFDPDVWATYVRTYRGEQMADPEVYDRFLTDQTAGHVATYGGELEETRSQLHDLFMHEGSIDGWSVPSALWERARARRAPSWDREHGHPEFVRADELPDGLLVDVTQLSPLPRLVAVPSTDDLPMTARLLIASQWGALSPSARARLEARGVDVRDVPITAAELTRVVRACWGSTPWQALGQRRVGGGPRDAHDEPIQVSTLDEAGPFAMSRTGLGWFNRVLPLRSDLPVVVVVGDAAADFALATALDRCMHPALWVPLSILGSGTAQVLSSALASPQAHSDREREVHVTSCSLSKPELETLVAALSESPGLDANRVHLSLRVPLPIRRPQSLLDAQLFETTEDELFVGDATGRGIRARLPSGVTSEGPFHLSWWNEVSRFDHQLPPRWALNEHLVARSGSWRSRARVTCEGLAFHSHPLGLISGSRRLDQVVDNPRIRFLSAHAIFDVLAAEAGLTLVESAAGRFTARTTELWGGLPALTHDLRRPIVRNILDAFQSKTPSGAEPGNYILERRYLSLYDLQRATGDHAELVAFVDSCLHLGVLRRGLSLACDHCSNFGWYDADDVGQTVRCARCRTEHVIDSAVVRGGGSEPTWYYGLAEVVYQARRHSFNVPLLALDEVATKAQSVIGMTDHKVVFADDEVEIDLWAVIDGRIVIGEAKTGRELESSAADRRKKAERLRRAADDLTADTLVLATAATSWSPSSIEAIENTFSGSHCQIDVRVNVDPHLAGSS